jgi:hypothetical protein
MKSVVPKRVEVERAGETAVFAGGLMRDLLAFEKAWHEGDGRGTVCQVKRAECEIILCQDAARRDKVRRRRPSVSIASPG